MTPEKQRIKIAEAHGWVLNPECDFLGKAFPQCWTHDDYNMAFHDYELPDYLNDLNAMNEAENQIKDWPKWVKMLAKIIAGVPEATRAGGAKVFVDNSILARATAAQRAEAFLRTLNLWES